MVVIQVFTQHLLVSDEVFTQSKLKVSRAFLKTVPEIMIIHNNSLNCIRRNTIDLSKTPQINLYTILFV